MDLQTELAASHRVIAGVGKGTDGNPIDLVSHRIATCDDAHLMPLAIGDALHRLVCTGKASDRLPGTVPGQRRHDSSRYCNATASRFVEHAGVLMGRIEICLVADRLSIGCDPTAVLDAAVATLDAKGSLQHKIAPLRGMPQVVIAGDRRAIGPLADDGAVFDTP